MIWTCWPLFAKMPLVWTIKWINQ
uniref:Uncharacterized protein n=1 Tax=Arundo donax TaxID=35708 RepID=A0A0A8YMB4_ARUDO